MALDLVRFDPFSGLDAIRRDLFGDDVFRGQRGKVPTTDVYIDDDSKHLVIEAHLPNFDGKDIDVDVDNGVLVINAQRHEEDKDKKKKYVIRESSSSFYRSFVLPEQADQRNIAADFADGVLTVTVPLTQVSAPTKIAIGSKSSG